MRKSTAVLGLIVALLMTGCGDATTGPSGSDGSDGTTEATMEDTLEFRSRGLDGNYRLVLEPDGSAEGQRGTSDPFTFTLEEEELATVEAALADADLPSQPAELRGDEPDLSDNQLDFVYGETAIEAEWMASPEEVRDLGDLLVGLVRDYDSST